jgi:uncharacterized protein YbjT (DUF2867 family)
LRILVLGVSGLIGSTLAASLTSAGHEIVGVSRSNPLSHILRHFRIDISRATQAADWKRVLEDVDAVVNCAGTLQDSALDSVEGVHVRGISALFTACQELGIRRVVHLSAIGVDRATPSDFSLTKLKGDQELMSRDLDWVILRPSVVIGRAAYGGSALIRGYAALPIMPLLKNTGPLQLVHLDDLIETIAFFLQPGAPCRKVLEVVGPRQWSFSDAARLFRRWLRWRAAFQFTLPEWIAAAIYRAGDAVRWFGWRSPVTSSARLEMQRGAIGNPTQWLELTGITPRDVEAELMKEPASVQERWFARMYVLKPLVIGVFGLFWIVTGLISLGPGWNYGMDLLREGGLRENFATLTIIAGALADLAIGGAILYGPTTRYGLYAALAISLVYVAIGTVLVPRLWSDPLGPLLKIWPVVVLNLVALAIREDR